MLNEYEQRHQQTKCNQIRVYVCAGQCVCEVEEIYIFQAVHYAEDHDHQQAYAQAVDLALSFFPGIRQGEEARNQYEHCNWNVDEEYEFPTRSPENIHDGAAYAGAYDVSHSVDSTDEAQGHSPLFFRECGTEFSRSHRHDAATSYSLDHSGNEQKCKAAHIMRQTTEQRSQTK